MKDVSLLYVNGLCPSQWICPQRLGKCHTNHQLPTSTYRSRQQLQQYVIDMTKYIRLSVTSILHTYFRPSHSHSHCLGTAQASNPSRYHSRTSRTLVPCMLSISPTNPLANGGIGVLGCPVSYGVKVRLCQCCLHGIQSMPRNRIDRSRRTA